MIGRGAVEAWPVTVLDPETLKTRRALFEMDAPDKNAPGHAKEVMKLYGEPATEPSRYLFVDKGRFVRPSERPELTLLPMDKSKKEFFVEETFLRFLRPWVAGGAFVSGLLFLVLLKLFRKSRRDFLNTSGGKGA